MDRSDFEALMQCCAELAARYPEANGYLAAMPVKIQPPNQKQKPQNPN